MKSSHIALALLISCVWGINFVVVKSLTGYFPTFLLLCLRMGTTALVLLPFMRKRPPFPWYRVFTISIVWAVIHFGFSFLALEKGLDVAVAAVVDQLRVPFAVILGYFLYKETLDRKGALGLVLALVGTFMIAGSPNVINNVMAFWLLLFSSLAWAFYNILVKNLGSVDVLPFMGWVSWLALPPLMLLSYMFEDNQWQLLVNAPPPVIAEVIYVAVVTTILAHGSWYYLLRHYAITQVVPYSLTVPVFGVLAGVILLHEQLTWELMVGSILTVLGVAIVVLRKPKAAKAGDGT